jgi:hypothetical protein
MLKSDEIEVFQHVISGLVLTRGVGCVGYFHSHSDYKLLNKTLEEKTIILHSYLHNKEFEYPTNTSKKQNSFGYLNPYTLLYMAQCLPMQLH